MCDCSLVSANKLSKAHWHGLAVQMPADLCPADSRGAIAIASAELPGKAMTSLFKKKKKNLSGRNAAMIQENTVFILQLQLNKSMGNRGRGYAARLSGASRAVSPATSKSDNCSNRRGSKLKDRQLLTERGESSVCVSNEDSMCVKPPS